MEQHVTVFYRHPAWPGILQESEVGHCSLAMSFTSRDGSWQRIRAPACLAAPDAHIVITHLQ